MAIRDNIKIIEEMIGHSAEKIGRKQEDVLLLAVTKLHSAEEINQAIDAGITDIGENKVQEILEKYPKVKDVRWHLIGHLQRNKVKNIIDKVSLIHSVDSLKLAEEIEKRAAEKNLNIDILIQINPADEESKYGVSIVDAQQLLYDISESCPHIHIRGLMAIAPIVDEPEEARQYFKPVKELFDKYVAIDDIPRVDFKYLSMGMSHDFQVAIEEGANIVRVGTAIFGNRNYRSEEL